MRSLSRAAYLDESLDKVVRLRRNGNSEITDCTISKNVVDDGPVAGNY